MSLMAKIEEMHSEEGSDLPNQAGEIVCSELCNSKPLVSSRPVW